MWKKLHKSTNAIFQTDYYTIQSDISTSQMLNQLKATVQPLLISHSPMFDRNVCILSANGEKTLVAIWNLIR